MPRNKYNARRVTIDNIHFASQKEAGRYQDLKHLQMAGEISNLKCHPKYTLLDPFEVNGVKYRGITYEADFEYVENGKVITEDVKGVKTQVFRIKEKLFMQRYGDEIEFRIV